MPFYSSVSGAIASAITSGTAIANQANLSSEEIDELEHQEIFIQDQRNVVKKALNQGIGQGKLETQLAIAQQLLDVLDDASISRSTGLSIEQIARLRSL